MGQPCGDGRRVRLGRALGRRGTSCSTNSGAAYAYPAGGITVDGTGVWTVACTSTNNSYDVNGHVASSPTAERRGAHR